MQVIDTLARERERVTYNVNAPKISSNTSESYEFYYDEMINSPDLTYRIIGVESTKANENASSDKAKVLVKDLIREPLSYSIVHAYSQTDSGLSNALLNVKAYIYKTGGEKAAEFMRSWNDFLNTIGVTNQTSLDASTGKRVVAWIDYFKTFQSTDISIPLNFNFRLYPRVTGGKVIGVKDQISSLNNSFIGYVSDNSDSTFEYYPPHGYTPATSSVKNNSVSGTLTLMYGRFAVIEGLLLTNYNVTMSQELTRLSGSSSSGESEVYSPAYADVSISLSPATTFNRKDINTILASDFNASEAEKARGWINQGSSITSYYDNKYY